MWIKTVFAKFHIISFNNQIVSEWIFNNALTILRKYIDNYPTSLCYM